MNKEILIQKIVGKNNIKSIKPIHNGVSNSSFLINNKYVVRIKEEKEHFYDYKREKDILKKTAKEYLSEVVVYLDKDGNKISEYIPDTHIYKGTTKENKLAAQMLYKLHHTKAKTKYDFKPFNRFNYYKSKSKSKGFEHEEIVLNRVKKIYNKKPLVICHNDCVDNNFLFTNKRGYLIDYEFASNNIPLFDLASFISENKITNKKKIAAFLDAYNFDYHQYEDLRYMIYFENLLWYYWALERYRFTNKIIYKKISEDKLKAIQMDSEYLGKTNK